MEMSDIRKGAIYLINMVYQLCKQDNENCLEMHTVV